MRDHLKRDRRIHPCFWHHARYTAVPIRRLVTPVIIVVYALIVRGVSALTLTDSFALASRAAIASPALAKAATGLIVAMNPQTTFPNPQTFDLIGPMLAAAAVRTSAYYWTLFLSTALMLAYGMIFLHGRIEKDRPVTIALTASAFAFALLAL